jgi:hypothetical protein
MFLLSFVKGGEYCLECNNVSLFIQVSESHLLMAGAFCPTKIKWPEIFVNPALEVTCHSLSFITVIHAAYILITDTNMFA